MANKFPAIATLLGTIIGAGILGIPYVIMQSGFLIGLIHLVLIAGIILIIYLYLGEISLRTTKDHQLPGYAQKYLGKKGKTIMFLALLFGIYSALIAYLIGEGESLSFILFQTTNYSLYLGIAFWFALSILSYLGIKALKESEELGMMLIFILIISITVLFWNKISIYNLNYNDLSKFYVPFGVILFAFLGFSTIPELKIILKKDKKEMKSSIIISIVLALIIYIIFTLIVLGTKGVSTPEIATLALGKPFILLGMLTMFTAYLALSDALIDTFSFDYNISKFKAWLLTILPTIFLFILINIIKSASFIKILGLGGVISGGISSILILLIAKKAKKSCDRIPEYSIPYSKILTFIIIMLLAVGTVFEIWTIWSIGY